MTNDCEGNNMVLNKTKEMQDLESLSSSYAYVAVGRRREGEKRGAELNCPSSKRFISQHPGSTAQQWKAWVGQWGLVYM